MTELQPDEVYLELNPPARSQFRTTRRAAVTGAIVLHTAENDPDLTLPDGGAEAVARFIARRTDAAGSYHSIADSDSIVQLGRYEWEMFHEGTGGNRWSLGLSFACHAGQWATMPDWWVDGALSNGAMEAARMARWVKAQVGIDIPAKRITAAQYRSGEPGFTTHAELDPKRRWDPGFDFPFDRFLERFRAHMAITPDPDAGPIDLSDRLAARLFNLEALTFIDWAYRFHLDRTPSRPELSYWLDVAQRDGTVAGVGLAIAESDEAKNLVTASEG